MRALPDGKQVCGTPALTGHCQPTSINRPSTVVKADGIGSCVLVAKVQEQGARHQACAPFARLAVHHYHVVQGKQQP